MINKNIVFITKMEKALSNPFNITAFKDAKDVLNEYEEYKEIFEDCKTDEDMYKNLKLFVYILSEIESQ